MKKSKISLDIFVSIIDNYGDMGFVMEFLLYIFRIYFNAFTISIFTNNAQLMQNFLIKNGIKNDVEVVEIDNFSSPQNTNSQIAISFLHSDFPKWVYKKLLRIDYLSFDKNWVANHYGEHIFSTKNHKIIELIPSPLDFGAGLFPKIPNLSFWDLQAQYHLPTDMRFVSLFVYSDTLENIDFSDLDDDIFVCIFGQNSHPIAKIPHKNIRFFPFIPAAEMYTFFANSLGVITRGEISCMQVLQMNIPFFWDIYHQIGGFPKEQAFDFLKYMNMWKEYETLQNRIWNQQKIKISEIITYFEMHPNRLEKSYKNICEEALSVLWEL